MDNESSCWQTDNRFQLIIIKKIQRKKFYSRCWHFHLCSVSRKNFNPIKFPFSAIVNHSIVSSRFYFSLSMYMSHSIGSFKKFSVRFSSTVCRNADFVLPAPFLTLLIFLCPIEFVFM